MSLILSVSQEAFAGTTADARAAGVGMPVTINNAVVSNTTDLINSLNVKNIHIQDAFGGITVFGGNTAIDALLAQLVEGDNITLSGTTSSFNGLFELDAPFTLVNNSSGNAIALSMITLADMQDFSPTAEGFESVLVRLNGVTFDNAGLTFVGSTNELVTDPNTLLKGTVRIATTALNMVGTQIPSGPVDIVGIFSQFDPLNPLPGVAGTGYQLQPRSLLDIIIPGSPPSAANVSAITKLDTPVEIALSVADVDNDPFDIIIESLPTTGLIFDNSTGATIPITSLSLPYTMADPLNPLVRFEPALGVGTDMSITYRGRQTTNGASGLAATATAEVQDENVIITEILYDPSGVQTESQWEWVEIYNRSASPVLLSELQSNTCPQAICGLDLMTGAVPLTINPGEVKVIVGTPSIFFGGILRTDQDFADKWGISLTPIFTPATAFPFLSNGGVELTLRDSTGDLLDFVPNYGVVPFPADVDGHSISLIDPALDNDNGANWISAVADCATGFKQVSDLSIGSADVVPTVTLLSDLTPCANSEILFAKAGAPTSVTVTLQGTLGPQRATVGFEIMSQPVLEDGLLTGVGTLKDMGVAIAAFPHVVNDPNGQVTFEDSAGTANFISFTYRVFEDLGGGMQGATSNVAKKLMAVQDGGLVITELMVSPANNTPGETYWEFVEVTNTSGSSITLGTLQADAVISNFVNNINLDPGLNPGFNDAVILPGETKVIARDALDFVPGGSAGTARLRTDFINEWFPGGLPMGITADNFVFVLNQTGNNLWDSLFDTVDPPGRFVSVWSSQLLVPPFTAPRLLDVVAYQNGQNGWPAFAAPNSIFYRGDPNGAPFTATGNDLPINWQESTDGCPGDASFRSDQTDMVFDLASPLALPTNPAQCVPAPCATCLGDLNGDNTLDGDDLQLFVDLVVSPTGFPVIGCADFNGDGNGLDYSPDVPLMVDALIFGSTDCPGFTTTHKTSVTIGLTGAPVAGQIELFIGGCDPTLACDTLKASPPFICFEQVTVTPATTAVQLAEELAFGLDRIKDGVGGLDEFCLTDGASVNVSGSTISIVFTRAAGLPVPCCYVQDTDGRFSTVSPFDFVQVGGPNNCVVTNLLNGTMGDEGAAQTSGFKFTKSE